jgi:hypothetical protein
MSVQDVINQRRISTVLHFTTNKGLTGILASGAIRSRRDLTQDKYLEHVYSPNCAVRRDQEWLGYVNLSISRINARLWDISANNWHSNRDVWWCILVFDPVVLTHDGVVFATTNNMYSGVARQPGEDGLEALFASRIHHYTSQFVHRIDGLDPCYPTCRQAEALYPGDLSTKFLTSVFVATEDHEDTAWALCSTLGHGRVVVRQEPGSFV